MPNREASVKIENVVASAKLKQEINIKEVIRANPTVEYNSKVFPGVVYRLNNPKTTTLIFSSGNMVCTGAKSEREAVKAIRELIRELKNGGVRIAGKPEIRIRNVVAVADLHGEVDVETAAYDLRAIYEPEQFPGLIYRMEDPNVSMLIFSSGKLVCAGAKKEEEAYEAVKKLHGLLDELGLIHQPLSK